MYGYARRLHWNAIIGRGIERDLIRELRKGALIANSIFLTVRQTPFFYFDFSSVTMLCDVLTFWAIFLKKP
jgi:hypothetical protein